jgi:hypothetical protein
MTAAGPTTPSTRSRGSVAHGARPARSAVLREGSENSSLGAYALPSLGRALALRALVGLTGERPESRMCWIHCAYEGTWEGHSEGAFTLTNELFQSCIDTFSAQRNPLPVDFEHASVRSDVLKAPAAGWVQSLELRDDGLYALVEWTEDAAKDIRAGAYRYCSGVFVFDKPDRKSGDPVACCLHSIALTNTPFIDGQKPIVLSQRVALSSGGKMEFDRGAFEEALKKIEGDKLTADQIMALAKSVEEMAKAQDPDADADIEVEVEEPAEMADAAPLKSDDKAKDKPKAEDAEKKALADAPIPPPEAAPMADESAPPADPAALMAKLEELAAAAGTDVAGLIAKLEEMIAGGAQPGGNPAAMSDDVKSLSVRYEAQAVTIRTLSAKLKKYEDAEAKARKKAADDKRAALDADVDSLVMTGVVLKADSDKLRALAHRDEGAYRDMVAVLRNRPAVPTGVEAAGRKVEAGGDQSLDVFVDMSQPAIKSLSDSLKRFGLPDEVVAKRIREHVARAPKASAG